MIACVQTQSKHFTRDLVYLISLTPYKQELHGVLSLS